MDARAVAEGLKKNVVEANTATYLACLRSADGATNPVWVNGHRLFRSLDTRSQEVFIAFMKNVVVDSVSSVLAVIDGVAVLDGQDGEVIMKCGRDEISGDLQDEFLALFEEK